MAKAEAATQPTGRPQTRAMTPFLLSASTQSLVSKLASHVKADQDDSGQMHLLEAKAMTESKNWSKVFISTQSWKLVTEVRESIVKEDVQEVCRQYPDLRIFVFLGPPAEWGLTENASLSAPWREPIPKLFTYPRTPRSSSSAKAYRPSKVL